ncbi:MAG TPA: precorrin-6y C5,15-methyltransferase (decarboxylating) subunit CbiE [Nitrospirota bacterium]
MQKANKLSVVGIGYRPLGNRAKELVRGSSVILASSRLFEVFQRYDEYEAAKDRIKVINKVPDTIAFIREWFLQQSAHPLVLLASGDPFFFGIGRRMIEEFGSERVEIFPDLSSVQTAFARINVPWDDAYFISLHGGPDIAKRRKLPYEISDIPWLIERHGKMGILTDRENNPSVVAKTLHATLRTPHSELIMHVCERLGYADEKITRGTPGEIAGKSFSDPNVVIIIRPESVTPKRGAGRRVRFGLKEDDIQHERGLITKDEVRAVTIHKLCLPQDGVLWDIGSGSGSISLEAARLCPGLRVLAVEKERDRIETIGMNMRRYHAGNVEIVHGSAPEALTVLPAPDRVFIGGSGGVLGDVLALVKEKMPSGIVVINAATLETLNAAMAGLEDNGFSVEVAEISVSRSKIVAGKRHMGALNPVFIVKGEKG